MARIGCRVRMVLLDLEPTDRPWSIGQLDHRLQRIPRLEIRPTDAASLDAYQQLVFGKLWHRHIFHTAITWSVIASGLHGVLLRRVAQVVISYACIVCAIMVTGHPCQGAGCSLCMACRGVQCYDKRSRVFEDVGGTQAPARDEGGTTWGEFPAAWQCCSAS
jgi:hypothetical protein